LSSSGAISNVFALHADEPDGLVFDSIATALADESDELAVATGKSAF
jgi:hypothetical protein